MVMVMENELWDEKKKTQRTIILHITTLRGGARVFA